MAMIVSRRVISLEGSDRRSHFFQQNGAQGFEVWNAFDGRTGAGRDLFGLETFKSRYDRLPTGGEIGCVLSHRLLIQEFSQQLGSDDDLMLVSEDDAVFAPDFPDVVERVARVGGYGVAVLAQPREDFRYSPFWAVCRDQVHLSVLARPVGKLPSPWTYRLGRYEGILWGAGLYLISRRAARMLTLYADHAGLSWLADDYETWHRPAGVEVQVVRPNLAGWLGDSQIHDAFLPHAEVQGSYPSELGIVALRRRLGRLRRGIRTAWNKTIR